MRQKLLLVPAAMLLGSSVGMAAIVDGVRQYPTWDASWEDGQPVASEVAIFEDESLFEETDYQYLYNIGCESFFRGANDWQTRATLDDTLGYKVRFAVTDAEKGYVALINYVEKFSEYRRTFADGESGIWVDNNTGANNATWQVNKNDDGTFTISNSAYPGLFLGGIKGDVGTVGVNGCVSAGIYLNLKDPSTANFNYTWIAVSEENYQAFVENRKANVEAYKAKVAQLQFDVKLAQYNAAKTLYAAIQEAEGYGLNVDAQKAVYLNEDATVAEIEAATEAVKAAITAYINSQVENATLQNQIEITANYKYLSELAGGSNNGEVTGWKRVFTGNGEVGKFCINTWSVEGNPGNDGTNMVTPFIENWVAKGSVLSDQYYYRDTIRVAPGAYHITANIRLYNESGAEEISGASIFANINASNLMDQEGQYLTYNNMLGYWKDGFETYAVVGKDSALILGIIVKDANFNWAAAKDFRLYALGKSYESVDKARQGDLRVAVLGEDDYVTKSIAAVYNAYVSDYKTSTDVEAIMAAASNIDTYYNTTVAENIAAWQSFIAALNACREVTGDPSIVIDGEEFMEWLDFVDLEADEVIAAKELTNEELAAKTAWLEEKRTAALQSGLKAGTDFTKYLTNADFSNGANGWSGSPTINYNCGEKYGSGAFDVYQEVKNAPVGVYEISMQGFYRQYRDDNAEVKAWYNVFTPEGDYKEVRPDTLGYVYMNNNKTAMNCVYDFQTPVGELYSAGYSTDPLGMYIYPNTMQSAAEAFAVDAYKVSAFGLVAKAGDALRIGVKGHLGNTGDCWVIFDNFKLTYQAFKVEIIKPEFEKALAVLGSSAKMGSEVKAKVNELKAAAEAVDQTDGKAMFDQLAAIYDLNVEIEESVALFAELNKALQDFEQAISVSPASAETKNEATTLYNTIKGAYDNDTYTNAQATEAMEAISQMTTKLSIPADITEASDTNEKVLTDLLKTPSFTDAEGNASTEGWTMSVSGKDGYSGYEFYDKDFDIYQEVAGLPAGTYQIGVQAFSRDGSIEADAAAYLAGTPGKGKLYAIINGVYYETSLAHGASIENNYTEAPGYGTEKTWVAGEGDEAVTYYLPHNMQSVQGYFNDGKYKNTLTVKVAEGETLRLGVKCENHASTQWIEMDNFTLKYYGANSSKETATDIENVASEKTVKVEMFSANGQRVSGLQQGVTIVRTVQSNGNVIVRKVFMK